MIEDRIGFFPASYAHPVKEGDRVFRCSRTFIGCKEQGQITIKEGQVSPLSSSLSPDTPALTSGSYDALTLETPSKKDRLVMERLSRAAITSISCFEVPF